MVLALNLSAGLVDLGNGDLDGSVILGLDDAVGGAALSGDVTSEAIEVSGDQQASASRRRKCSQVHDLSLVVFHLCDLSTVTVTVTVVFGICFVAVAVGLGFVFVATSGCVVGEAN